MATEGQQENPLKSKIQGLLTTSQIRGLSGQAAINEWLVLSMEALLQSELDRLKGWK
jgi:hypothetical protein